MAEPRDIRVLLVDDNRYVAELLVDGLDGAARRELKGRVRFQCEVCGDGQAALAAVDAQPPDLVILDVYMPVMDGAEFLRRLRARPSLAGRHVPVLALSAGGPAARDAALAAGADLFFDKPIRLHEVFKAVQSLLAPADP